MKYQNIGTIRCQTHALRHGAGHLHSVDNSIPATAVLSRNELRELVAAMID